MTNSRRGPGRGAAGPSRPRLADVVVRRRRLRELAPVVVNLSLPRPPTRNASSPLFLVYGFLGLILAGTGLLMLPQANTLHAVPPFNVAFFTATSAVTVTGLTLVDTPTYWSAVGHVIIVTLIGIGGLGWMTMAGFILVAAGQRMTLPRRMALRQAVGVPQLGGVVRLMRNMVITAVSLQVLGGLLLAVHLHRKMDWDWGTAMFHGLFHAISGFNNAGFAIVPNSESVSAFHGDYVFIGILTVLIMLGGLSFFVLRDIVTERRFSRFSVDTKIVVPGSIILWVLGAIVFFAFESRNNDTLGQLPLGHQLLASIFHSASGRTAGFGTVNFASLTQAASFFLIGLMFIGAASASTGGGIRLNTFGVIVATVVASIKGQATVTISRREIAQEQVHRAIAVAGLFALLIFTAAFFLTFTEQKDFMDLFFETVSAMGTVGASKGVTPELSLSGQVVIIITMLVGRLGPLTLALALGSREQEPTLYHYATEHVKIG